MGKSKRRKAEDRREHTLRSRKKRPEVARRIHSNSIAGKSSTNPRKIQSSEARKEHENDTHTGQRRAKVKVPFKPGDHVLLVGEGDFSFALTLAEKHCVESITATCYDSKSTLLEKYPHAERIIAKLQGKQDHQGQNSKDDDEFQGCSPPQSVAEAQEADSVPSPLSPKDTRSFSALTSIHYGIDATKLSTTHQKLMRRHGPFTKIAFNFPHVGGLSTDVNRQTRANQKLIQGFFGAAKEFLASPSNPLKKPTPRSDDNTYDYRENTNNPNGTAAPLTGQILVTLFTGEAYADWNIRDIARDQHLRVVESFRFPWEAYPDYRHARTIGEVKTGKDRSGEGKRKGAWRGEEREARCFVFEVKREDEDGGGGGGEVLDGKRKRRDEDSDSDGG